MTRDADKEKTGLLKGAVNKIREINERFRTPRIHMSRAVKFSLLMLRLYLIFLVLILAYKFYTLTR